MAGYRREKNAHVIVILKLLYNLFEVKPYSANIKLKYENNT